MISSQNRSNYSSDCQSMQESQINILRSRQSDKKYELTFRYVKILHPKLREKKSYLTVTSEESDRNWDSEIFINELQNIWYISVDCMSFDIHFSTLVMKNGNEEMQIIAGLSLQMQLGKGKTVIIKSQKTNAQICEIEAVLSQLPQGDLSMMKSHKITSIKRNNHFEPEQSKIFKFQSIDETNQSDVSSERIGFSNEATMYNLSHFPADQSRISNNGEESSEVDNSLQKISKNLDRNLQDNSSERQIYSGYLNSNASILSQFSKPNLNQSINKSLMSNRSNKNKRNINAALKKYEEIHDDQKKQNASAIQEQDGRDSEIEELTTQQRWYRNNFGSKSSIRNTNKGSNLIQTISRKNSEAVENEQVKTINYEPQGQDKGEGEGIDSESKGGCGKQKQQLNQEAYFNRNITQLRSDKNLSEMIFSISKEDGKSRKITKLIKAGKNGGLDWNVNLSLPYQGTILVEGKNEKEQILSACIGREEQRKGNCPLFDRQGNIYGNLYFKCKILSVCQMQTYEMLDIPREDEAKQDDLEHESPEEKPNKQSEKQNSKEQEKKRVLSPIQDLPNPDQEFSLEQISEREGEGQNTVEEGQNMSRERKADPEPQQAPEMAMMRMNTENIHLRNSKISKQSQQNNNNRSEEGRQRSSSFTKTEVRNIKKPHIRKFTENQTTIVNGGNQQNQLQELEYERRGSYEEGEQQVNHGNGQRPNSDFHIDLKTCDIQSPSRNGKREEYIQNQQARGSSEYIESFVRQFEGQKSSSNSKFVTGRGQNSRTKQSEQDYSYNHSSGVSRQHERQKDKVNLKISTITVTVSQEEFLRRFVKLTVSKKQPYITETTRCQKHHIWKNQCFFFENTSKKQSLTIELIVEQKQDEDESKNPYFFQYQLGICQIPIRQLIPERNRNNNLLELSLIHFYKCDLVDQKNHKKIGQITINYQFIEKNKYITRKSLDFARRESSNQNQSAVERMSEQRHQRGSSMDSSSFNQQIYSSKKKRIPIRCDTEHAEKKKKIKSDRDYNNIGKINYQLFESVFSKNSHSKFSNSKPPLKPHKYKGGKNIIIDKAARFREEKTQRKTSEIPGPGSYETGSDFDRHCYE